MSIKQTHRRVEAADGVTRAAGILFFCVSTKKFLLIYRSPDVVDPSCWCSPGGKIEPGETPEQAAIREAREEIGFSDGVQLSPLYLYKNPRLEFHNFLGLVPREFTPEMNWESSGYVWCRPQHFPRPLHYGMREMFSDPVARDILKTNIQG
jgi:8-oxo-dGTP pyrophosphatase MutT (NUDIX family)